MDSVAREEDVRGSDSSPFGTLEGAIERTPKAARMSFIALVSQLTVASYDFRMPEPKGRTRGD